MAVVWIPAGMRSLSNGDAQATVPGATLREVLDNLELRYPGFRTQVVWGELIRNDIAVAIDGDVIHQGLFQPVEPASEVHFLPALSGG